jgi:hypothetical protein
VVGIGNGRGGGEEDGVGGNGFLPKSTCELDDKSDIFKDDPLLPSPSFPSGEADIAIDIPPQ